MNDDGAEVHQDPLAVFLTFHREHGGAERLQLFAHVVGERLDLARRVGAGDDDALEQGRKMGDFEHDDVAGLDVFERGNRRLFHFADIH